MRTQFQDISGFFKNWRKMSTSEDKSDSKAQGISRAAEHDIDIPFETTNKTPEILAVHPSPSDLKLPSAKKASNTELASQTSFSMQISPFRRHS
jgi:hypothetical protein